MSEIVKTFENSNFHIVKEGDAIWWWGKEVAEALGYARPRDAIRDHIKEDEKRLVIKPPRRFTAVVCERLLPHNATSVVLDPISSDEGDKPTPQNDAVVSNYKTRAYQINECGLYRLIFTSKLPKAEEFRKWVFNEVLPSIRKTGVYQAQATRHNQLCIRNETDLHYEVAKEIRKRFPNFVLTIPGGEMQDTAEKRIDMYKKGFKGGMPDIMIMNPHRFYNGMVIELKTPGGSVICQTKRHSR